MDKNILAIREDLKKKLKPARYEHTLSVSYTCMALAMRYGYDLDKAELAGLLHDCAKCYTDADIIEKCKKIGLELTEDDRKAPSTIHAKLGAWMASKKYGVNDSEITDAIACHTTGKADMGLLDKILYIADYIEPRRFKASDLDRIRVLAFIDLEETLFSVLKGTLDYLTEKNAYIDKKSYEAYEYYKEIHSL